MPYRHLLQRQDYSDYASGKVFYGLPGHPAFPVRLALEVFERCLALRAAAGATGPARLYDPCCGGAYHLAVLALFHWPALAEVSASDLDADVLAVARRNLALLTPAGLAQRVAELEALHAAYGKPAHAEALASAAVVRQQVEANWRAHAVATRVFPADAGDSAALRAALPAPVDLVITDVPYGQKSSWQFAPGAEPGLDPIGRMLAALRPSLSDQAVLAVIATKQDRVAHPAYAAAGKLKLGHRLVTFLRPAAP